ncbi:hypothetical protein NBRC116594_25910 [Shimia sp. NS0008-38b]
MQRAFWCSFVAAGGVYLLMLFWSLPVISASAGGLVPFDMRPTGYSVQDARQFLAALSEEGRDFYLSVQLRLDLLYPALLGMMLVIGFQRVFGTPWSTVFSVVALIMVSADYLENYMISIMLHGGASGINDSVVALASFWTTCKSVSATVAFCALLLGAMGKARRRWV